MRNSLAAYPWVKSVSASDINLGRGRDGSTSTSRFGFDQDGTEIVTNYLTIDYDYLNTLGIKLLAGRDFDRQHKTDENAVLINKEMADLLGGPEKALNSTLEMDNNPTIVGIVDNFHIHDLKRGWTINHGPAYWGLRPIVYLCAHPQQQSATKFETGRRYVEIHQPQSQHCS